MLSRGMKLLFGERTVLIWLGVGMGVFILGEWLKDPDLGNLELLRLWYSMVFGVNLLLGCLHLQHPKYVGYRSQCVTIERSRLMRELLIHRVIYSVYSLLSYSILLNLF